VIQTALGKNIKNTFYRSGSMLQSCGGAPSQDLYARSNVSRDASGARCTEEIIRGRDLRAYRIPWETIVGFLPRRKEGTSKVRTSYSNRPDPLDGALASVRSRCAPRAERRSASACGNSIAKSDSARNNPPIRSSTDACVQFAFKCREKLALHFVRWKIERKQLRISFSQS